MEAKRHVSADTTLRPAATVMRLERLGSLHQSRLSFSRVLLRRMGQERWAFERAEFDLDHKGVGVALYRAHGPERSYTLVCYAHDLPAEQRSDRVIATAWDATFTLFDGTPTTQDLQRLAANVPLQEDGRISASEIILSRANRSVRLFEHVVESLAEGRQPDTEQVEAVGYLMRTTAVYGSGKFGAAVRESIAHRAEFSAPFQAEMLSVYLIRAFTIDLVEHLARIRSPSNAVRIDPSARRNIGVGNSTGLGLAPFIVNHPILLNNWIAAREQALARVRALPVAEPAELAVFRKMLERARLNAINWRSEHPLQVRKVDALRSDLEKLDAHLQSGALASTCPWDRLYRWAETRLSVEGQEQLVSLLLEPYGALVDGLSDCMATDEHACFAIDGSMHLRQLQAIVEEVYGWAIDIDWTKPDSTARVWYVSEAKLEPRLGERLEEPIEPYEQPLAPGRDAAALHRDLCDWDGEPSVAAFLLRHPEHRHIARRAQVTARYPYAEIRDNTISSGLLPIDLLRCKLSFFGATHFDPRSDRWVRINMFQNAPLPDELNKDNADDWSYPALLEKWR